MDEHVVYLDANWDPVESEAAAVFRLITVTGPDGSILQRRRESLGERKERKTYSTDPRAGAIMREGGGRPMSRPVGKHK